MCEQPPLIKPETFCYLKEINEDKAAMSDNCAIKICC